jgi:hypothetical protein
VILAQDRILRVKAPDTFFGLSPNAIIFVDPALGCPIDISIAESKTIAEYLIDHYDGRRCTWGGHKEVVQLLLEDGADTNVWEVIRLLLEDGARSDIEESTKRRRCTWEFSLQANRPRGQFGRAFHLIRLLLTRK